jgi:hypothetical protein
MIFNYQKVICLKCNHCRDIDLCRDPYFTLADEEDKSKKIGWFCFNCNEYYDLKQIEFILIEALHSKIMAHVTQDIKCLKCNEVTNLVFRKKNSTQFYHLIYLKGKRWVFTKIL